MPESPSPVESGARVLWHRLCGSWPRVAIECLPRARLTLAVTLRRSSAPGVRYRPGEAPARPRSPYRAGGKGGGPSFESFHPIRESRHGKIYRTKINSGLDAATGTRSGLALRGGANGRELPATKESGPNKARRSCADLQPSRRHLARQETAVRLSRCDSRPVNQRRPIRQSVQPLPTASPMRRRHERRAIRAPSPTAQARGEGSRLNPSRGAGRATGP